MSKSNFYRDACRPTQTAAGCEDLTFHDPRHSAASMLLAHSGAELAELKFVLGHSQIAYTVDLYGHLEGWPCQLELAPPRHSGANSD